MHKRREFQHHDNSRIFNGQAENPKLLMFPPMPPDYTYENLFQAIFTPTMFTMFIVSSSQPLLIFQLDQANPINLGQINLHNFECASSTRHAW